jgi:hypothetical protein
MTETITSRDQFADGRRKFAEAMGLLADVCFHMLVGFSLVIHERIQDIRWTYMRFKGWLNYHRHKISSNSGILRNRFAMCAGWAFGLSQPVWWLAMAGV